jgi:hypothetical protein
MDILETSINSSNIIETVSAFLILNIVIFYFSGDNNILVSMKNTLINLQSKINSFQMLICTTLTTGYTLARCGWFLFKVKYLGYKIPIFDVPKPTINITKESKTKILIEYTYNNRSYKILSDLKRGPSKIVQFLEDGKLDVTDKILPFIGHNDDFHGIIYTPSQLGYKNLLILDIMGEEKYFGPDDNIIDF